MEGEKDINSVITMKHDLCDISRINNTKKYTFYYDESNNCRKFWVNARNKCFNTDYMADFVLAGLVKKDEDIIDVTLEKFRKELKLQRNVKEIKFNKLYSKGDFLECIKEKRLFETLSWIDKSPFYIHCLHINNLYYTLVEIFDSIVDPKELNEYGYEYFKMKSVFYTMFKKKEDKLQVLMFKYKYPNVQRENIGSFCNELRGLIESRRELKTEEKFLDGMILRAAKSDELIFLHDNRDYILQENYAEFYLKSIQTYPNSIHIFDEEMVVQDIVKKQLILMNNVSDNFKFVKSEEEIFVQLSDVISGILGKMFKYINSVSLNQLIMDIDRLTSLQVDNILLIYKLCIESERENHRFLCSVAPIGEVESFNRFFGLVKKRSSIIESALWS